MNSFNIVMFLAIAALSTALRLPESSTTTTTTTTTTTEMPATVQPTRPVTLSFEEKLAARIPANLPEKVRRYLISKARALAPYKFTRTVDSAQQQQHQPTVATPALKKPLPLGQQQELKKVQPAAVRSNILKKPAVASASESVAAASVPVLSSVAKPTAADKNWLMTKAWLIDNINRLHRDLSQLERSYATDLNAIEKTHSAKEKQLLDDVEKLRQEQTILASQQRQLIMALKRNALSPASNSGNKFSKNDIHYTAMKKQQMQTAQAVSSAARSRVIHKRDTLAQQRRTAAPQMSSLPGRFQRETTRNMQEVYAELSSLHDISLTMIDCMKKLEHRVEMREQFAK